jgi:hypothetical protein
VKTRLGSGAGAAAPHGTCTPLRASDMATGTTRYPSPQILSSYDTKRLPELLAMVMGGRIAWPDFQRVFHWTEQQICGFLPSLLRGAPVPNMVFWKWAEGAGEAADNTVYKALGCAGHYIVRRPELGVVDGGHRLNCLCYLLDSRDDNGFVPSYRVTKAGLPYKRPTIKKFCFYLPELEIWMRGRGEHPDKVVVAFTATDEVSDIDYVPTRIFYSDEDDGASRMETFVEEIAGDHDNPRHGAWLDKWSPLLRTVEKRIAGITLPVRTINCARKYAIESYLWINTSAQPLTKEDLDKAKEAAKKDKTKVFDELMDHRCWKGLRTEGSHGHRVFQSRPFLKELVELAAVLLFECGLESGGKWWEWGRLTKLEEAEMTKESQIDHADDKYAEFARDNMEAFVKRLVQAYERSSQALGNFPAQFFPKRLIIRTFLAFVLADSHNVPINDKMKKLVVRTLCNIVVDDKSDQSLDSISGPIQMFKGASLKDPLSTGVFDFERLPEWHIKHTLCSEQVDAWVSLLCVLHADTAVLNSLVADKNGSKQMSQKMEKHHIFPKGYMKTAKNSADFNHVNSLYNLMPISHKLNNAIRVCHTMPGSGILFCYASKIRFTHRTPRTGRRS